MNQSIKEIVAKMRADLTAVGGFANGMLSVPAGGVRAHIERLEAALAEGDTVNARLHDLNQRVEAIEKIAAVKTVHIEPGVLGRIDALKAPPMPPVEPPRDLQWALVQNQLLQNALVHTAFHVTTVDQVRGNIRLIDTESVEVTLPNGPIIRATKAKP